MQDGGQKGPHYQFPPVTFTNVGISRQSFLTFSINPFAALVQNIKAITSSNPNYWT